MDITRSRSRILGLMLLSLLSLLLVGVVATADSPPTDGLSTQDGVTETATDDTIRVAVNDSSNGADNATVPITIASTDPGGSQTPGGINQDLFDGINSFDGTTSGELNGLSGRDLSTFRRDLIQGNLNKAAYAGLTPSGRDYSALRKYLITGS